MQKFDGSMNILKIYVMKLVYQNLSKELFGKYGFYQNQKSVIFQERIEIEVMNSKINFGL